MQKNVVLTSFVALSLFSCSFLFSFLFEVIPAFLELQVVAPGNPVVGVVALGYFFPRFIFFFFRH